MKKLMVAAVAAFVGLAVNAVTVKWQTTCGWVSPDDENALEGAKFYLFDATAYSLATFTTDIGKGTETFKNAIGSGAVNDGGEVNFLGNGMTTSNDGTADWAKAYAVILAENAGKDYYYMVGEADPVKITSAILSGGACQFAYDDIITGSVGGSKWTQVGGGSSDVPEPTSGLLMLLGMAGLALRRKQK